MKWYFRFNTGLKLVELVKKSPKAPLFIHHSNVAKYCRTHPSKAPHILARASCAEEYKLVHCNSTSFNNQVCIDALICRTFPRYLCLSRLFNRLNICFHLLRMSMSILCQRFTPVQPDCLTYSIWPMSHCTVPEKCS